MSLETCPLCDGKGRVLFEGGDDCCELCHGRGEIADLDDRPSFAPGTDEISVNGSGISGAEMHCSTSESR